MLIILFSARQTCSFSACSTREKPFYATNNNKKSVKSIVLIVLLIGDPFFLLFRNSISGNIATRVAVPHEFQLFLFLESFFDFLEQLVSLLFLRLIKIK